MGSTGLTASEEPSTLQQHLNKNMVVTKEVTRGVFDPRTYREDDPTNWARKRKPEWMATTGKIHYVRERTVESQEKELEEEEKKEAAAVEIVREPPSEAPVKTNVEKKEAQSYWPRKMRSDITRSRVV